MEKQRKKQVKRTISWGLVVVLVALLAVMPLLASRNEATDGPLASILSGTAQRSSIDTRLIGGGTLAAEAPIEITIPAEVKLTGYQVGNGDTVQKGDVIATVDRVTVMTAITQVQETMDYLAEEIEAVIDEEASDTVTAQAGGTVKIIYAQEGEKVQDVMLRDGALAVLSLDGMMAVQVDRKTDLSAGDTVCVVLSDGTEVDGKVESNLEGVLTVVMEDDDYAVGAEVKLTTEDGDRIGSGTLYIHSRWNATAYSGTVSDIRVSEGATVSAGKTLMKLEETGSTAAYYQLTAQHRKYEALMLELFRMYQTETITAPCDGVISGVDEDGVYMLSDQGAAWEITFLVNSPNGDDESAYTNFIGQVTAVGIDGLVLNMNPQPLSITDYKDLSGVPLDASLMTESVIYSTQAPVYELVEGEWAQLDVSEIVAGDLLLFAGDTDGNFVWVVRVATGTALPEPPEATEPVEPSVPADSNQPAEPSDDTTATDPSTPSHSTTTTTPTTPSASGQSGGGIPQGGGSFSGIGGGVTQEEAEYELYTTETVTIASVTSQEEMTVEITIDELDITEIFVGQEASVTVDALPGETFAAAVTQIANSGESSGGNSKFTVELTLEKSGDMLPGMSASAVITLGTVSDVVCVPVAALTENGTETILYTSYDGETGELGNPVAVTVGVSDGEHAQILSGIEEGSTFYYPYYDTLVISDAPDVGGFGFRYGR